MTQKSPASTRCTTSWLRLALPYGVLAVLSACASTGSNTITGWDQITIGPGDTGTCESSPCEVFFKMPPGSGSYEVTANETKVGVFPAGQTVSLGSFWQSQGIQVPTAGVPQAYAYIPAQR